MLENIAKLESERELLYKKLSATGDFRRGLISTNYRKCGKKNCICSKEGHPGHGPQYLWSATIKGKSYAKNLKLGPELQKWSEEVANYRCVQDILDEIIEINERICNLRPVSEVSEGNELEALKKKLQKQFLPRHKKRRNKS